MPTLFCRGYERRVHVERASINSFAVVLDQAGSIVLATKGSFRAESKKQRQSRPVSILGNIGRQHALQYRDKKGDPGGPPSRCWCKDQFAAI
ncbi:MAG: hypothetical protein AAFU85_12070 [Planctomycetota bacterium]